jgi:hypothetical protein
MDLRYGKPSDTLPTPTFGLAAMATLSNATCRQISVTGPRGTRHAP